MRRGGVTMLTGGSNLKRMAKNRMKMSAVDFDIV